MGDHETAKSQHILSLGIYKQLAHKDPQAELDAAQCLVEIAAISQHSGDPNKAKTFCLSALRTYRKILGQSHPQAASAPPRASASPPPPLRLISVCSPA